MNRKPRENRREDEERYEEHRESEKLYENHLEDEKSHKNPSISESLRVKENPRIEEGPHVKESPHIKENPHENHRERVKQRFVEEGMNAFEDHQVLELLLFYTIPRKDTNEMAHNLLKRFGTLESLFDASPEEIQKKGEVSRNTAVFLSMVPQLARRYMIMKQGKKPVLDSSAKAGQFITSLFIGKNYEAFYVCCLNSQNQLNYAALVHEGTINEAPVYPRLIVETALRYQASSIILAHNHPGGSLKPSGADIEVTRKICDAMKTISIPVVDHMIAAGSNYFSFAENGLL